MTSVGLEVHIVKVASGGLDESFLWQNLASGEVMRKVEGAMARFNPSYCGATLGEGGEFETLALDGPDHLFKGRIVVDEEDRKVIKGIGGTSWVQIGKGRVEMKNVAKEEKMKVVKIPDLLSKDFRAIHWKIQSEGAKQNILSVQNQIFEPLSTKISLKSEIGDLGGQKCIFVGRHPNYHVEEEVEQIMAQIRSFFDEQNFDVADVVSTVITLRSMKHFAILNKVCFHPPLCWIRLFQYIM
jgi:hypothetical protein